MPDAPDSPDGDAARSDCLSLESLERELSGELPPLGEAPSVEHLRNCIRCQARLEELRGANAFLARIRPDPGPEGSSPGGPRPGEGLGSVIGRYKLLQQIGEGGFGIVFLAEQREPVKRRVALKLVKLGMDSKQVIARFEAERQALAMMDHPNIAKVFDAGATEGGRPYFVMELVRGVPITQYCDNRKLDTSSRIELFASVCHAIQHAHQKGVIHRDIKPNNVLVTLHDGIPIPKVIDFGIAKAMNQELTERTLFTEYQHMIGTPTYMSPEQAEMSGLDIDTRCDIYSLGVLLYELLTGTTPFDSESLVKAGFLEMIRIIREQEPPRPSTRLSTLGATATRTAECRHVAGPQQLRLQLQGDLDWIVMKCLEKDRTRRYATAAELAADLRRHLRHEPVEAGAPGTAYRIRKFVRRHRTPVISAAAIAMLLIALVATTTGLMMWALRAKERLDIALAEESERAAELEQMVMFVASQLDSIDPLQMGDDIRSAMFEETRAALETDGASPEQVTDRLAGLQETLADTSFMRVALHSLRSDVFAPTLKALERELADQPLLQARLEESFAGTLSRLDLSDMATAPLQHSLETRSRLLGEDSPDALSSRAATAALLLTQDKAEEAERILESVVMSRRRVLGDTDPATLSARADLGRAFQRLGRLADAERCFREVLDARLSVLGAEHPDTLTSLTDLGDTLHTQGRLSEAEPYLRDALSGRRRALGNEHRDTLESLHSLGAVCAFMGNGAEADQYMREAVETARRTLGDNHTLTLKFLNGLAVICSIQGRTAEEESYLRQVLGTLLRTCGATHRDTLTVMHNLGVLLLEAGDENGAEPYLSEALDGRRRRLGESHFETLASKLRVGELRMAKGEFEVAEPLYRAALADLPSTVDGSHPAVFSAITGMAKVLVARNGREEAARYVDDALAWSAANGASDRSDTLRSTVVLGEVLNNLGRFTEALRLLRDVQPLVRMSWIEPEVPALGDHLLELGLAQWQSGDIAAGEETLAQAYAVLARGYGATDRRSIRRFERVVAILGDGTSGDGDDDRAAKVAAWRARLDAARGP